MGHIISFREFLRTGRLGPIHTGLSAMEVARLLGSPKGWNDSGSGPFPTYWKYGKLELSFRVEPAAPTRVRMEFFQIEYADSLYGDCEVIRCRTGRTYDGVEHRPINGIGDYLVIALDGLDGRTQPAGFVTAMHGCPGLEVVLERTFGTSSVAVRVMHGPIEVIHHFDLDDEEEAGLRALSTRELIARSKKAKLDSIYSHGALRAVPSPDWFAGVDRRVLTAEAYLEAVGQT